ncbi:speckle-type POZ protein-like [Oppia nitens]|uniref:speckle-type POZ protein-like n=1 Tax=Oppia nitens TaxID=1686743 RepID=UPI0023DC028E|nr:speckle-type POZ protein-like [Oppia nitens]
MDNNNNKIVYKTRVAFKVMNFAKQLDTNWTNVTVISSDKFMIGSDEWYCNIEFVDESVGLYLQLSSSNELPIETQYEFSVIDTNNQLFAKKKIQKTFDGIISWGIRSLITRQQLLDNKDRLLPYNTLTVGIDVMVYKNNSSFATKNHRFKQLFSVKELTDCRLIVGKDKKVFYASKLLLSSNSEVFEKMFTTDCKEKITNEVVIDDIESNVFDQFLNYLYTGKCNKLDEMTEELLYVADKYMVSSLKTICLNLIYLQINDRNALQTLKLFQDFGADKELVKKVSESFAENITSVLRQEFIKHFAIDSENMLPIVAHLVNQLTKPKTKLIVAQWKRAGPITQRSVDRNHALL